MESEETGMDLCALHRHGWSISALARRFQINRRTVAREVAPDGPRAYPSRAPKHPLTPAQLGHIERRLLVCPMLRATDLHRELQRVVGYQGNPTFGHQLRPLRPPVVVEAEVRFETAAGVQTWVDWKHLGLWPLGEEMVQLHALVAVLGHGCLAALPCRTLTRGQILGKAATAPGGSRVTRARAGPSYPHRRFSSRGVRPVTRTVSHAPAKATALISRTIPTARVGTLTSFSPERSGSALSATR